MQDDWKSYVWLKTICSPGVNWELKVPALWNSFNYDYAFRDMSSSIQQVRHVIFSDRSLENLCIMREATLALPKCSVTKIDSVEIENT